MSENRRRRNNGAQNRQVKKARTNNARRILLLVGLMSLVAVISIGGTIAWLTDSTQEVTNTFTAADIDIDLVETWNADKNNDGTNDAWEAKLVPGTTYAKDPKVTVKAGSEACWLFVHVDAQNNTITKADGSTVIDQIVEFTIADGWTAVTDHDGYYYRNVSAVAADATEVPTFSVLKGDTVKISEALTKEQEKALKDAGKEPKIVITAAAVQSENVGTLADAWAKLPTEFTTTTP